MSVHIQIGLYVSCVSLGVSLMQGSNIYCDESGSVNNNDGHS
jgi:hypothetical protein